MIQTKLSDWPTSPETPFLMELESEQTDNFVTFQQSHNNWPGVQRCERGQGLNLTQLLLSNTINAFKERLSDCTILRL